LNAMLGCENETPLDFELDSAFDLRLVFEIATCALSHRVNTDVFASVSSYFGVKFS